MYRHYKGYWRCNYCPMKFLYPGKAYHHSFVHRRWRTWA